MFDRPWINGKHETDRSALSKWDPNNVLLVADDSDLLGITPTLLNRGYSLRIVENLQRAQECLQEDPPGFLVLGRRTSERESTLPFIRDARSWVGCADLFVILVGGDDHRPKDPSEEFTQGGFAEMEIVDWVYGRDAVYNHIRAVERKRGYHRLVAYSPLPDGSVDLDASIVHRESEDVAWGANESTLVRSLVNAMPGSVSERSLSRYWADGQPQKLRDAIAAINASLGVPGIVEREGGYFSWFLPVEEMVD